MKLFARFWMVIAVTVLSSCTPDPALDSKIQQLMDKAIARHGAHGASVAVIFPDGHLQTWVSGVSHDSIRMHPDMLFGLGSVTKNCVATLTLKLAEEGLLSLEDPLSKWLPDFPHVDNGITIRQLLNHTSGLYMFWENDALWKALEADKKRIWKPEEVLEYIKEPHFEKGSGWRYSNTNYLLLGMLLEKATGTPLPKLLRLHLWQPLGIQDAYVSLNDHLPMDQLAHVYGDDFQFGGMDADLTFAPRASHESITFGSSGVFMSARSLALYTRALFTGEILKPGTLDEMMTFVNFFPVANMEAYGLGVQRYVKGFSQGKTAIGHGGGNIGTTTYQMHLPDQKITIVVMVNAFPSKAPDLIDKGVIKRVLSETGALGWFPYIPLMPWGIWFICMGCFFTGMTTRLIRKKRKRQP
jgi:D-alanyl-D-alanine carboxypeptidase